MYSTVANEASLKEDCIQAARQLKVDALQNIVEGHQIWPSIQGISTDFGKYADNWRAIRGGLEKTKHLTRSAANSFLAWKFGVKPLVHDIADTIRYGQVLKTDMERIAKTDHFKFSRKAELSAVFDANPAEFGDYNSFHCVEVTRNGRVLTPPTVRYVLVVKPKIRFQTEIFKSLDHVLSKFTTSPADLAWEEVPFSFVADWFFDIRGTCRWIDKSLGLQPFEVINFTRSFSYNVETAKGLIWRNSKTGSVLSQHYAGSIEYKHYERTLVSTDNIMPVWKPHFGKNQAAITAALLAQRFVRLGSK
jgi:hypothetical protein